MKGWSRSLEEGSHSLDACCEMTVTIPDTPPTQVHRPPPAPFIPRQTPLSPGQVRDHSSPLARAGDAPRPALPIVERPVVHIHPDELVRLTPR